MFTLHYPSMYLRFWPRNFCRYSTSSKFFPILYILTFALTSILVSTSCVLIFCDDTRWNHFKILDFLYPIKWLFYLWWVWLVSSSSFALFWTMVYVITFYPIRLFVFKDECVIRTHPQDLLSLRKKVSQ